MIEDSSCWQVREDPTKDVNVTKNPDAGVFHYTMYSAVDVR